MGMGMGMGIGIGIGIGMDMSYNVNRCAGSIIAASWHIWNDIILKHLWSILVNEHQGENPQEF